MLYIYDGKEGYKLGKTLVLPDGKHLTDLVPNMKEVINTGRGEVPAHKRDWAHKFSATRKD